MRKIVVMLSVLILTGCTSYTAVKETVVQSKRHMNDEQLGAAVQVVCRDAAIGAIRRKYDDDFTKWRLFCIRE